MSVRRQRSLNRFPLAFTILLFCMQTAYSGEDGCGDRSAALIKQAYPAAQQTSEAEFVSDGAAIYLSDGNADRRGYAVTCRVWPSNPRLLLAAVPLITSTSAEQTIGDLEVLVLDTVGLGVQQRLRLTDWIQDDAIKTASIMFDTARYHLAKDHTAFGVRQKRLGSSQVNPIQEESLFLFAIEEGNLKVLLNGLDVRQDSGEWDGNCEGAFASTIRTLAMDAKRHLGHADILVTERSISRVAKVDDQGGCSETSVEEKPSSFRLVYGDGRYAVPEAIKPL